MELTKFPQIAQKAISEAIDELTHTFDPEYILLGGSFGKGDWIKDKNGKLLSDFEIIFINKKSWNRKKAKKIAHNLKEKYKLDFSIAGYSKKRVLKKQPGNLCFGNPGYITLNYFDAIKEDNVIYKKNKPAFKLPETNLNEVPMWEAWRLFVNRFGDLLKIFIDKNISKTEVDYYWQKAFQAAADTLLISISKYESNISDRYNNWREVRLNQKKIGLNIPDYFLIPLEASLKARLYNSLKIFSTDYYSFSDKEKIEIILFYFDRIEKKMFEKEGLEKKTYKEYLSNKSLINKYSNFYIGNKISNLYSNILSLVIYRKQLCKKFKYYKINEAWRHIYLISIMTLFREYVFQQSDLTNTKQILNKIYSINNNDFIFYIIFNCRWFR